MQLPAVCKKINIWTPKYVTTILLGNCGEGVLLPPRFVLRKPPGAGRVPRGTGMYTASLGPDGHQKQQKKSRATPSRDFCIFEIAQWFHTGSARCIKGWVF